MRFLIAATLCVAGFALSGCGLVTRDIREVTLTGGGVAYNGKGGSSKITFRRDGTAEKMEETFEHDFPKTGEVSHHYRAPVSKEQFERLVKAIESNGFFSKKERDGVVYDAYQNIEVVYTGGSKKIETLARHDPQIDAVLDAIIELRDQLQWDEAAPTGTPQ